MLVHTGTNDLTNSVNTMSKVRKIVKAVEEMDGNNETKLGFSSIIVRRDRDQGNITQSWKTTVFEYFKYSTNTTSLNRKGTTYFIYKKYLHIFSSRFEWNAIRHPTITDSTNQPSLDQNIPSEKLKELRLDNPKNLTFSYLNINSVRNKLDSFQEIVMGKVFNSCWS